MLYGIEGILGGKLSGATALGPIDRLLARKFFGSSGSSPGEPDTPDVPVEKYSWEGVAQSIKAGTYKTDYAIGDLVPLDLGSEGVINMQIAAFDADTLADGSGTAAISWVAKELLKTKKRMNVTMVAGQEGTGSLGGWEKCEMRTYLQDVIKPLIPADVSGIIRTVSKSHFAMPVSGSYFTQITMDDLWLPDSIEIRSSGAYGALFPSNDSRVKKVSGSISGTSWWLRNSRKDTSFEYVGSTGSMSTAVASGAYGVCLGFCTG